MFKQRSFEDSEELSISCRGKIDLSFPLLQLTVDFLQEAGVPWNKSEVIVKGKKNFFFNKRSSGVDVKETLESGQFSLGCACGILFVSLAPAVSLLPLWLGVVPSLLLLRPCGLQSLLVLSPSEQRHVTLF